MLKLFKIAGFTSYILIMFLNAMTDLGHKIILQNTIFKSYESSELIVLTSLVNALILLPFVLLFKQAGNISDRFKKTKVVKYSALFAVFITIFITISYYKGWFYVAFFMTFILASQSAIYSPAKYGLIKEMVEEDNLTKANAIVQAVTIVSILLGAIVYSVFFENLFSSASSPKEILQNIAPLGFLLVLSSFLEFLIAIKLEKSANIRYTQDIQTDTTNILKLLKQNKSIWKSIIALSIFWAVSQIVVSIFGEYLKSSSGETNTIIAQGLLSLSGVGIIAGSLFTGKTSMHEHKNFVKYGAFLMSLTLLLIPFFTSAYFLAILILLFGFGAGMYIVPLNTTIQQKSDEKNLGKILAGNNLFQNLFMIIALFLTAIVGYLDVSSKILFIILGFLMVFGGFLL